MTPDTLMVALEIAVAINVATFVLSLRSIARANRAERIWADLARQLSHRLIEINVEYEKNELGEISKTSGR